MKVKSVMYDRPQTLNYQQTLADALKVYEKNQVNCAPIV
ncbi:MAG: hypothetical protein PWQ96_849, partial [Clostridia bacterium]|nr:hypothetical protein [Clostridia bacterium]